MREVRLGGRSVDPRAERAQLGAAKRRPAASGPGLALVQFAGPVKDAWLGRVRGTGVRVVTYVAQNGYVVHGTAAQLERLAGLLGSDEAVRAVTPLGAADKIAPGAAARGRAGFEVQTLTGEDGAAPRRELAQRGRQLRLDAEVGPFHTQYVEADAADVRALAADPGVVSVLPFAAPELLDERAALVVAGDLGASHAPSAPGYLSWLAAQGFGTGTFDFALDVTDSGIDTSTLPGGHADFYAGGSTSSPTRIAYKRNYTFDAEAWDCNGHGTNVASIAAGYNDASGDANREDAQGYNFGLGVAPRARVGSSKIFDCGGAYEVSSSLPTLVSNAYGDGARVSNNSWGAAVGGAYNTDSQTYDALVRDAQGGVAGQQQIVELFANGNDGPASNTVGSPGTAKNVISVGAAESVRPIGGADGCGVTDADADSARDIVDFSSRGPTDDGRTKPDVVSPGTHVTGAAPQIGAAFTGSGTCDAQHPAGNALYSLVSGTSQATPGASGFAALIRDHYRRTAGGGSTPPSPAMTKAIMVNTATDLAGGVDGGIGTIGPVPTNSQGWGRINARNAFDSTARSYTDQTVVLAASGDAHTRTFSVPDGGRSVKLTLVWSDPPGPTSGASYVNDLDLTVEAGGQTYKGNVFSGGQSASGGTADVRNNVENVFLPAGTGGPLTVTVTAANVAGDGVTGNGDATDQDFALVASNVSTTPTPALAHDGTTVTEVGGDGNGRIEPGEAMTIDERLRNAGDAAATGVEGTLTTSTSGVTVTQGTSAYPDIAAGATGTNATPFAASVASSVPCGTRVQLALSVTRTGGSSPTVIPIEVPTGQPAASATTRTSSDVPKAIPDNSTAGVDSTLTLSDPGRIADLDVRVSQLTHTWIGDLHVVLVAPDGTTVTLAQRPGGVDNDGDDLTNTIFDDEAPAAIGATGTAAPYTGRFRPQADQLSRLDGKALAGTWTLRVSDVAGQDVGTLEGWGLDATPYECGTASGTTPTASFTATPSTAPTGQTVSFDGSGSSDPDGTIATYEWDLDGNGSFETSTGATPAASRAYADDGAVDVGLRVTDDDAMTAETTRTVTITNRSPVATYAVSPSPAQPGQTVTFNASSSTDPDGTVATYRWDIDGDGTFERNTGTSAQTTHAYTTPGARTTRLMVTDDDGATAVATAQLRVNAPPRALLSASPNPAAVGQTVTFSAAGSSDPDLGDSISQYRWDLDGAPGYELTTVSQTVTRSYPTAGARTVRLQVVDGLGTASEPAVRSLEVTAPGGGTGGGGTGGGDTGGTGGSDSTPPRATVARPSTRLADLLRGRWRARVRCDEPCAIVAHLYRGRAPLAARQSARPVVLARASGRLTAAGSRTLTLRPTAQGRRALRSARRIAVTLRVRASDAAGNLRMVDRRLTLRR
jgi:subtilisin-like proprotein convertase family protein